MPEESEVQRLEGAGKGCGGGCLLLTACIPLLQLAESDFASTFRLLTVFAYGTYSDYLGN